MDSICDFCDITTNVVACTCCMHCGPNQGLGHVCPVRDAYGEYDSDEEIEMDYDGEDLTDEEIEIYVEDELDTITDLDNSDDEFEDVLYDCTYSGFCQNECDYNCTCGYF